MSAVAPLIDTPDTADRLVSDVVAAMLGLAFTWALFWAIAFYEKAAPAAQQTVIEDLQLVTIPFAPPPPPQEKTDENAPTDELPAITGFTLAPSDSPVKIAVSPPTFDSVSSTLQLAPPANIRIGYVHTEFKPRTDPKLDALRIYQQSEVDRRPAVLSRADPVIPRQVRNDAEVLQVTLLLIIDQEGVASQPRLVRSSGNFEFDAIILDEIKTWSFSPGMKNGRPVRCLVQQTITVRWSNDSLFHL